MIEREHHTPERPTPAAIFQAMHSERGELSIADYVASLHGKYDGSRTIQQAKIIRNGYRTLPWVGITPQQARAIRTSFLDGFVVGYHVARKSIPESAQKRAMIADTFHAVLHGIIDASVAPGSDAETTNAAIIRELSDFAESAKEYSPEYFTQFNTLADDVAGQPDRVEFAKLGYGVAVGLGIAAGNAVVDPED